MKSNYVSFLDIEILKAYKRGESLDKISKQSNKDIHYIINLVHRHKTGDRQCLQQ